MSQADAAAVTRLCHQLGYGPSEEQVVRHIGQLLQSPLDACFVGEEDGTVLAWIHVRAGITLTSAPRGEIIGLVVDQDTRHRGLGRALMRHAETWALEAGLLAMRVRSAINRDDAHVFYEAAGFRKAKRQDVFDKALERGTDGVAPGFRRTDGTSAGPQGSGAEGKDDA
jgi:GNAT superfamily N-acetyltransferase